MRERSAREAVPVLPALPGRAMHEASDEPDDEGTAMSIEVVLPPLGESVFEGTVARWLVAEGETIEVDQPLVEVTTDKVDAEIPAPSAGMIEQILVA